MCPFPEFEPILCTVGTYAPQEAMSFCAPCPHGYSCSSTSVVAALCPSGTYSYLYETTCKSCPRDHACTGMLKLDCPLNFYADPGSKICIPCPHGSTCMKSGPTKCLDGQYAVANSYLCRKCPFGNRCTAGIPYPCDQGTYAPVEGLSQCQTCPTGTYSLENSTTCENCPGGHRCPGGKAPIPCLPGQYSVLGDADCHRGIPGFVYPPYADHPSTAIFLAPKGMYSKSEGPANVQIGVYKCPAGSYSAHPGATVDTLCIPCPEGFYCPEGTGNPIFYMCPQGHYCPVSSKLPTPCPKDSYSLTRGGRTPGSCRPCPLG